MPVQIQHGPGGKPPGENAFSSEVISGKILGSTLLMTIYRSSKSHQR